MLIDVQTGADARVAGVNAIDASDLGGRFSGFRSINRFDAQTDQLDLGLISWPGGTLAEAQTNRYGLEHDNLIGPGFNSAGLSEMMAYAKEQGAGLAIVLPTVRYAGKLATMKADVRNFLTDLLDGTYGPLPDKVIFHIGSEYYLHFDQRFGAQGATEYGKVASAMVKEINSVLGNSNLNPDGVDIEVGVQPGRNMTADTAIRGQFMRDDLASVDLIIHHRYPFTAEEIDPGIANLKPVYSAWQKAVTQAGGEKPELYLSEWNVASLTREEALERFIAMKAGQGVTINPASIDMAGRTSTEFERFWQDSLGARDYGDGHARLYLEHFSEYQAEGVGASTLHALDLMHAGRATHTDASGAPVEFVGGKMIEMLYESVEGLTVMDISTENSNSSDLWTYGFENDQRLVMFLASDDDAVVGRVSLDVEGLEKGYAAIWADSLTAEVPKDWMQRFGVVDNARVDESNEAQTYALGVQRDTAFTLDKGTLSVTLTQPGEVVRLIVARTPEEAAEVAKWAGQPQFVQNGVPVAGPVDDDFVLDLVDDEPVAAGNGPTNGPSNGQDADPVATPNTAPPAWAKLSLVSSLGGSGSAPVSPVQPPVTASPPVTSSGVETGTGAGAAPRGWARIFDQGNTQSLGARVAVSEMPSVGKSGMSKAMAKAKAAQVQPDEDDDEDPETSNVVPLIRPNTPADLDDSFDDDEPASSNLRESISGMANSIAASGVGGLIAALAANSF